MQEPDGHAEQADLADWVGSIATTFEQAASQAGLAERRLRVAGAPVLLRGAGPLLTQLSHALDHVADESDDEPELVISTWDSATPQIDDPPLPETDGSGPRGTLLYSSDGTRQVAYQVGLAQLSAYDGARNAWFWARDGAALPWWEPAAPFRQILHWWLAERDLMLLHGASVGLTHGGVLLVGRGGSGKSTCALSSLESNLLYAGDDYVAVGQSPVPYVSSLYCSGKLQPGHAKLLPHLPPPMFGGDGSEDEKAVFYVSERFAERMCTGFPLRAVLAPRVVGGTEPRLLPMPPAHALRALAPSTLMQLRPPRPDALSWMARLLQQVPAYELQVGGPIDAIPRTIERLLVDLER